MSKIYFEVSSLKGEIPLYVLLFVVWLFGGMVIYSYGIHWNLICLLGIVAAVFLLKKSGNSFLSKKYYVQADDTGIAYRLGIFGKEIKLIWELIEHVDIHMYEINFTLKSDGTVSSMALSPLKEEEKEEIKKFVYLSYQAFKAKQ